MQHLEGSGTPVLYIGRTVLKSQFSSRGKLFVKTHAFLFFLLQYEDVVVVRLATRNDIYR